MVSMPWFASTLLASFLGITRSSAFAPPTQHGSISRTKNNEDVVNVKLAENGDSDSDIKFESYLSSLPSPDVVKENILKGKVGERGEQYVIAQFSLFLFIAIGGVPLVGDSLLSFIGPSLILVGLFLVYRSAADLGNNLSPWPAPAQSGNASLVNDGIYSKIRHPMYAGALMGMTGLSLITDSVPRSVLTLALYFVLDAKSDFEETKLIETYGSEYEDYRKKVQCKFLPQNMNDIMFRSRT